MSLTPDSVDPLLSVSESTPKNGCGGRGAPPTPIFRDSFLTIFKRSRRWIFVAAAVFHIIFTTLIYCIGACKLLPEMFDPQGIGEFASDGVKYLREIISLVDVLRQQGMFEFIMVSSSFHLKLYAISFALLQPFLGYTILGAELFNLLAYVTVLWLVNALGREMYNPKVGLYSVVIVGLWPSFLLYTTQLYKTPLFVIVFLVLVLSITRHLSPHLQAKSILGYFALGLLAIVILWFIRNEWWPLFIALLLLAFVFLIAQMVIAKRLMLWQMLASAFLLLAVLGIQKYAADFLYSLSAPEVSALGISSQVVSTPAVPPSAVPPETESSPAVPSATVSSGLAHADNDVTAAPEDILENLKIRAESLALRIGQERYGYIRNTASGSNIDEEYHIKNIKDLICYVPRALAVGLFSPFPDMWFSGGAKLGLSARMLSGLETLFMYGVYVCAFFGIWYVRRQLSAWYLVASILTGVIALGVVISNIGALYRFRFSFWMIIIVFGVGGYNLVAYPFMRDVFRRFRKTH